ARQLGPVFRIAVFGGPTACFVGPEAFALVLDDKNVARAGANPPHVEELFNPEAVPFLDGEKQRRRKRLLMRAFAADALEEYLPTIEQVIDRYANRWAGLGRFAWVPELNAMGFAIAGSLFIGTHPQSGDPHTEAARCAVEALPTLMLKVFAVRMLRRFDWSVENQDLSPTKGKIFATPASGLQVELTSM